MASSFVPAGTTQDARKLFLMLKQLVIDLEINPAELPTSFRGTLIKGFHRPVFSVMIDRVYMLAVISRGAVIMAADGDVSLSSSYYGDSDAEVCTKVRDQLVDLQLRASRISSSEEAHV